MATASILIDSTDPLPLYSPGGFFTASASFTRPSDTNAYAIGDRVANATSGANVLEFADVMRATGEAVRIERVRMRSGRSSATLSNAQFRTHWFRTQPTVSVDDNGVFNNASALALSDVAGYVGTVDLAFNFTATAGGCGVGIPGSGITVDAAGTSGYETSLWCVVEALAAYAPASAEQFTITIEGARS